MTKNKVINPITDQGLCPPGPLTGAMTDRKPPKPVRPQPRRPPPTPNPKPHVRAYMLEHRASRRANNSSSKRWRDSAASTRTANKY